MCISYKWVDTVTSMHVTCTDLVTNEACWTSDISGAYCAWCFKLVQVRAECQKLLVNTSPAWYTAAAVAVWVFFFNLQIKSKSVVRKYQG